jgi:large subunit ribosomal protein L24|tara:strand:- start:786 stop:1103 length:318 start_codon:yes stop_codon:yes gene_type:complete
LHKIKKGDEVIVLTGKDKGRRGQVLNVIKNRKVLIENVNLVKKHQKGNPNTGEASGIIEKEMPIHVSNVMLFNPITKKGDKVGFRILEDGRKVRFFKSNNEVVDI